MKGCRVPESFHPHARLSPHVPLRGHLISLLRSGLKLVNDFDMAFFRPFGTRTLCLYGRNNNWSPMEDGIWRAKYWRIKISQPGSFWKTDKNFRSIFQIQFHDSLFPEFSANAQGKILVTLFACGTIRTTTFDKFNQSHCAHDPEPID